MQNYSYNSVNLCKTATLKNAKNDFQDLLSLNAGQTYCRMFQKEHSAILSTFMKLPVVIKTFVLSIFEWPFFTGFTVHPCPGRHVLLFWQATLLSY